MTTGLTFRRYQDADRDAVWSVFADCTTQLGFKLGPWDDDLHDIADVYLNPGGEFIVGELQGQIVAIAAFRRDADERAEVRRVGVHPDVQRRGYGQALMAELEAMARKAGITSLHLDASQIAAQKLYLKCGYEEVGHVVKSGVECILYEKHLGDVP